MKIDITLEQALDRARPGLRYRIEQSVALLRKAQKLAKFYDPEDGFFLAFSGGKDSQCLFHVAQLAGVTFRAHFSPTSVDPPQLIKFIRRQYPEVVFEKIDKSMYEVAKDMGMVPTMKLRWCCARFKETAGAGKVTLTGVRHAESVKRAQRKDVEVSGHKFAGTIEDFFGWSEEQIAKKYKNVNRDEFDRELKEEFRCINGKDSILINPIIEWSDADVWDFLNKVVEVPHCELYDPPYNRKRIGCILCPMSSYATKQKDIQLYPYAKKKWLEVFEYFIGGGTTQVIPTQSGGDRRVLQSRGGGNLLPQKSEAAQGNGKRTTPLRLYGKRAAELPPPAEGRRNKVYTPGGLTRNGHPRWGEAGVSLSAEVLFNWWLTHDSWETFRANMEHPTLFDDQDL